MKTPQAKIPRQRLSSRPTPAERYKSRPKKRKLHPAWEKLLQQRIDAVIASGGAFGRPPKGSTSKVYEDSITEAVRAGDVTLLDLGMSSEICAKGKTWKRWETAAKAAGRPRA